MSVRIGARRGCRSAPLLIIIGGLFAACAPRVEEPAPVVSASPPPERGPERITVQRGQTLSEIAHSYHVPMRVIAEANGLAPPYRIQVGRTLVIPGAGPPRIAAAAPSVAALPAAPPRDVTSPAVVQSGLPPPAPDKPPVISAPLAPPSAPPESDLSRPQTSEGPPAASATPSQAPPRVGAENTDEGRAISAPAHGANAFLWPVRGQVLASYGSKSDGTRNDGINIAAPRGAAVQAVDAGVVAYTGNELHGYGNLVLIKHPNGWISAYAHCDQILVKRGEKVGRGQVIARVGSTGNVSEPQLHFELRRGQRAVDPKEFLPPLPTAAVAAILRSG